MKKVQNTKSTNSVSRPPSIALGDLAPPFELNSTDGVVSSKSLRGKPYVLFFYPKDSTPGCTLESQEFSNLKAKFNTLGVKVFGVSRDSIKSHEKFQTCFELKVPLLSDSEETLCSSYSVIKQKNMYGKKVMGIERSTFLVDANGVLLQEWRAVKPAGHAQMVLSVVKSLFGKEKKS